MLLGTSCSIVDLNMEVFFNVSNDRLLLYVKIAVGNRTCDRFLKTQYLCMYINTKYFCVFIFHRF